MADTLPNITIPPGVWVDLYTLSGIAVGTKITVENTGAADVYLAVQATQPATDHTEYNILKRTGPKMTNSAGDSGAWAFCPNDGSQVNVSENSSNGFEAACGEVSIPGGIGRGISLDAWAVQKTVQDESLLHGMFTFEVPQEYWKESINRVEQTDFINADSIDGELVLSSNGILNDSIVLDTFRNPRYQPNRGYRHAVSLMLDGPTLRGIRRWGSGTEECGLFFELEGDGVGYELRLVSRTTIGGITIDTPNTIPASLLPLNFDPEMGNIYDVQAQMRMVGDFRAFIGSEATGVSQEVLHVKNLNKLVKLSLFNPAFPLFYECINKGDDVTIRSGCVDISSEGGQRPKGFYGSTTIDNESGQITISGFNVPVMVVKNRMSVPGSGLRNTRDAIALVATAYSNAQSIFRVWATRDETAITLNDQTWVPFRDGNLEYIQYDNPDVATPITFDTTKADLIFGARVNANADFATSALFEERSDVFHTPGDIFIFTVHRENGGQAIVGATYEFAEEV